MVSVAAVMVLLATRLRVSVPSQFYLIQAERARTELDWAAAVALYQKAWRHDPKSYDIANSFGDYYLARATWNAAQRQEWEQNALVWFERAHIHNPHAADVLVKKARLLDARGDQAQAHQRYRLALEFDPTNASYHAQLGLHYRRWNKIDQATASFIRAYELGGAGELPAQQLRQLGLL